MSTDDLMARWASLLVRYSLELQPRTTVVIQATTLAEPLVRAVYDEVLNVGSFPVVDLALPGLKRRFFELAADDQLDVVSPVQRLALEEAGARIAIQSSDDPFELDGIEPGKTARVQQAASRSFKRFMERSARDEIRWIVTLFPTEGYARQAGMSFDAFRTFVHQACGLYHDDPVRYWSEVSERQQRLVDWLQDKRDVHISAPGTDLRLSIDGRSFINCSGTRNLPDGEIFASPLETSATGSIYFGVPSSRGATEVRGVRLQFEAGEVVEASAEVGESYLLDMLAVDPGARRLGEFAFGMNPMISRSTGTTLLDEKIGGTVHLALGASYPEAGGTNQSAIHWDMVCDLRPEGSVEVDGVTLLRDGENVVGPFA